MFQRMDVILPSGPVSPGRIVFRAATLRGERPRAKGHSEDIRRYRKGRAPADAMKIAVRARRKIGRLSSLSAGSSFDSGGYKISVVCSGKTGARPMTIIPMSQKGQDLIKLYAEMADKGYNKTDGSFVPVAYADFGLSGYKQVLKPVLQQFEISTLLDYGCGGSDWNAPGFDESGQSAIEYFGLSRVAKYEPARNIDQRGVSDGVVCFDVLEHVHILDVRNVLIDIFRNAAKLAIINVACYSAVALLPNGENAHITVRQPLWWKGLIDSISVDFPNTSVWLLCSTGWHNTTTYAIWKAADWAAQDGFVVKDGFY